MSSFTDELVVSPLPDGRKWKLVKSFEYHVGTETSNIVISVPKGFVTDFASSPFILWWLIPPWGKYGKAAIVHDACYQLLATGVTRKEADRIFKEAMCVLDCPSWQVTVMWLYVRMFGWLAWRRKRHLLNK